MVIIIFPGHVSRSSTEVEYMAIAITIVELIWLTHLLVDLNIPQAHTPLLLCGNLCAFHLTVNLVFQARTKHIEIDYHFVREQVALHHPKTRCIRTSKQLADVFTKALLVPSFSSLSPRIVPMSSLSGGRGYLEIERQFYKYLIFLIIQTLYSVSIAWD